MWLRRLEVRRRVGGGCFSRSCRHLSWTRGASPGSARRGGAALANTPWPTQQNDGRSHTLAKVSGCCLQRRLTTRAASPLYARLHPSLFSPLLPAQEKMSGARQALASVYRVATVGFEKLKESTKSCAWTLDTARRGALQADKVQKNFKSRHSDKR